MDVAVVGCGSIADTHIRCIQRVVPWARVALVDRDRVAAKRLANRFATTASYASLDELFSNKVPDAVHILTPLESHAPLAEKAISAGCHVYIEKPVTQTLAEFQALARCAGDKRRVLTAGYSVLGMPVVACARRAIQSSRLGRLIGAHCDFFCAWPGNVIPYGDHRHWAYSLPGGVLQNMADHPMSLVVDALDEVEDCRAIFLRRNLLPRDCGDLLHVVLSNRDQIGSFTLSLGHSNANRRIAYFLEGGVISVDLGRQLITISERRGPENAIKKTLGGLSAGWSLAAGTVGNVLGVLTGTLSRDPGIAVLVRNFYGAIRSEEPLLIGHQFADTIIGTLEMVWDQRRQQTGEAL